MTVIRHMSYCHSYLMIIKCDRLSIVTVRLSSTVEFHSARQDRDVQSARRHTKQSSQWILSVGSARMLARLAFFLLGLNNAVSSWQVRLHRMQKTGEAECFKKAMHNSSQFEFNGFRFQSIFFFVFDFRVVLCRFKSHCSLLEWNEKKLIGVQRQQYVQVKCVRFTW